MLTQQPLGGKWAKMENKRQQKHQQYSENMNNRNIELEIWEKANDSYLS